MGETFPTIVYVLCFLTSAACALLLGRSYHRTGVRLLFWSGVCFVFLAINNLALVVDLVLWPDGDLRLSRVILSLFAVVSLLWGFILDSQEMER